MGGPRAAAGAVAIALAAPAGPVIANMDTSVADQDGHGGGSWGADGASSASEAEGGGAAAGLAEAGLAEAVLAEAVRGARRPVVLLGTGAIPATAAIRDALAGRGIPALHTYRARGVLPDSAAEAAGLVTGGTMEWPLLSAADLIVGLGVDEAEMIPAPWDYAARTILVTERAGRCTGGRRLVHRRDRAEPADRRGGRDAGRVAGRPARLAAGRGTAACEQDAARRLAAAAVAAPGRLAPQQVVATARACAPPETIATVDAGAHMLVAMPLWEVPGPRMLLTSSGLATMGYALPAAIAAALCARRVLVLGVHRRRRPGHDAGRDRDGGPAVAAGHRDRLQRRRAQPDQDQAAAGRAGRRGGGPVRPGLVRRPPRPRWAPRAPR